MVPDSDFSVTPYDVSGAVDYEKLTKQFGTKLIDDKLLKKFEKYTGETHFMLRRKVFFSHRDLDWLFNKYDKNEKFYLYTGRAPSGPIHIGHLMPWIFTKWLQDKFGAKLLFQIPDEEKFFRKDSLSLEQTKKLAYDNILDIIALGFSPKKTEIFLDTEYAKSMYSTACRISKNITASTIKGAFGFTDSNNIGEFFYTSMQAVPAVLESVKQGKNVPCLIPYAIDQDPHFRVARDVIPKLGFYKPAAIHCKFLPPLQGVEGKMSSSKEMGAILTTDSPEVVRDKIMKYAFSGGRDTLKEHREKGGNPDIDVSYQWLRMMFEPDDKKLENIYFKYKGGEMLTGELKQILVDKVNVFLKKHQLERKRAEKRVDKFLVRD